MIRVKSTGFAKADRSLERMEERMDGEMRRLLLREANVLRGDMVRGIRAQAPGGDRFVPLSPITIERKGSSKALIDRGDLIRSINVTEFQGGQVVFVGVNRTEENADGEPLADIFAIHEFGTGDGSRANIPARPVIRPTTREWEKVGPKRISDDLARKFGGK